MCGTRMGASLVSLILALGLAGCARHDVRCDGKLQLINGTAPGPSGAPRSPGEDGAKP
jgi:hypothetical protein